jgi:magnesium chelatase subunit D
LRAAAPHQAERRAGSSSALVVKSRDFMEKVFRQKTGRLVLFVVDASGSVGSLYRMSEAKAAAMSLLSEAYRKRDRVGLIAFHNAQASVLLPPTNSVEMASRLLQDLPTGGKTPLAAALVKTHNLVRMETAKDPSLTPLIVVMTDGRPNVPLTPGVDPWPEALRLAKTMAGDRRLRFLLVDTDRGHYNDYKLTRDLAASLNAPRLTLEDLREGRLTEWLERM